MKSLRSRPFSAVYTVGLGNSLQAFVPQFWANESLAILEENMVMGNLVHRDFEPIVANFGDTVNTRRPGLFQAMRKTTTDSVTVQDATATNVQVVLNQHIHTSFLIRDGEESKSMKNLVDEYMAPSMLAQAQFLDRVLTGQVYQFLANSYGGLGQINSTNTIQYITGVRNIMNKNKAYSVGRNLVLTPNAETALLQTQAFTAANLVGDDGTALREASLGRKYGYDIFMAQNEPSVPSGVMQTTAGAVSNVGGYPVGTTTMTVSGFTGIVQTGMQFSVAGENGTHIVTAHTETTGNTTSITFSPPLNAPVAQAAVITVFSNITTPGTINQPAAGAGGGPGTGYYAGWGKEIAITGFTIAPMLGQSVTFGTAPNIYSIVAVDGLVGIILDRPLDVTVATGATVNLGGPGEYNFAFHRNALCLVCRPLAMPRPGTGALSAVVNMNNLSMRATITYDGNKQGHLVTLDMLCGTAILDTNLGAVMLG